MSNKFVISDTHFNHANILKFSDEHGNPGREFEDVQQMNEHMIEKWNSVVKKDDKVYHLGDVFLATHDGMDEILSRLNGKKFLALGNHDQKSKLPLLMKHFKDIDLWYCFPKDGLTLTHMPLNQDVLGEPRAGGFNVHGHIHKNKSPDGPYKCVCVEQINYTPIEFGELRKL